MQARQTYLREMAARFLVGFETEAPLRERLVRFWSNHFAVSNREAAMRPDFVASFAAR